MAFDPAGAAASVHRASVDGIEVDGIETRDHLAFLVSGMSRDENLAAAAALMPAVRDFLTTLEA
jgi:hypothetical protein